MKDRKIFRSLAIVFFILQAAVTAVAQTSTFTYQGRLTDGGTAANGAYIMEFRLFGSLGGSDQIGATISNVPVTVTNGVFTTRLDFGVSAFTGADRFLAIAVKKNAGDPYTPLSPRQQIDSSPYAIQTLKAQQADLALDSEKLGGVPANQYVQTTDTRLTNDRNPLPGSANYIQNTTGVQSANFNISGNGFIGGNFGIGTTTPAHRLSLGPTGPAWTGHAWTGSVELTNTGAIGWRPNTASQSFGIGQTNWGLSFFRSQVPPGSPGPDPIYAMNIDNNGNVGIGTLTPITNLDVAGSLRTFSSSISSIVVETTGSTTAAVLGMSAPGRTWLMGTSANAGNAFQLTGGLLEPPRMTIQPNDGPINFPTGSFGIGGNATQSRDKGGWVKAMVLIDNGSIVRCFNSQAAGSAVNTVPCNLSVAPNGLGGYVITFNFQVSDRFIQTTPYTLGGPALFVPAWHDPVSHTPNQLAVVAKGELGNPTGNPRYFVFVF